MFGALVTLRLFHEELDLYAFVGLIMLFGVVKENAIMMIDFALEAQRVEGKAPFEAICSGCLLRFRSIIMTTVAALLGTLPIALGYGKAAMRGSRWECGGRRGVGRSSISAADAHRSTRIRHKRFICVLVYRRASAATLLSAVFWTLRWRPETSVDSSASFVLPT